MTVLFPHSSSPELEPFAAPFGRMMLAFGRAHETVVALASLEFAQEADARQYVAGTEELPKKMRRLFRDRLDAPVFAQVGRYVKQFSQVAAERHHLIHGEWWFDPFDGGRLIVRRLHRGELTHALDVTTARIEEWTAALEEVAEELGAVYDTVRRGREAGQTIELLHGLHDRDGRPLG